MPRKKDIHINKTLTYKHTINVLELYWGLNGETLPSVQRLLSGSRPDQMDPVLATDGRYDTARVLEAMECPV